MRFPYNLFKAQSRIERTLMGIEAPVLAVGMGTLGAERTLYSKTLIMS